MFQTATGVTVPFPEKLSEQYQRNGDTLKSCLILSARFMRSWRSRCSSPSIRTRNPTRCGIWTA